MCLKPNKRAYGNGFTCQRFKNHTHLMQWGEFAAGPHLLSNCLANSMIESCQYLEFFNCCCQLCCEWFRGNYWCAKIHARVNFAIVNWNSTRWWLWKKNMWLYRSDAYPLKSCCCSFCSQYIRMNFLSRIPLDATFRILPLWSSKKMQGNSNEEARSANALVNQSLKVASI